MHDPMVYYFIWILTPVVPAYAMFKWLPSDATATGPLGGLKWKLGGAFAGYFAIVLISLQPVTKAANLSLDEQKARAEQDLAERKASAEAAQADLGERWTISGQIRKPDGSIPFETKFVTQPPLGETRDNGTFSVEVLLPRRKSNDDQPPDLLIKNEGFLTVQVTLPWDDTPSTDQPPPKYSATRNPKTHTIKINPTVVLDPEPTSGTHP